MRASANPSLTQCPECDRHRALLEAAFQRIADLEAEVRDLRQQLNRNSSNSSIPPSTDPPGAPKPTVKRPTGRKPGAQPGHPGHHRQRLPAERVNHVIRYVPTTCLHCHHPLPEVPAPHDPEPRWHQVAELPELAAIPHGSPSGPSGRRSSAPTTPAARPSGGRQNG